MAKVIHCNELFPGCKFVAYGADETALLVNAAHHWTETHDVRDIDQGLLKKARVAMQDVAASVNLSGD